MLDIDSKNVHDQPNSTLSLSTRVNVLENSTQQLHKQLGSLKHDLYGQEKKSESIETRISTLEASYKSLSLGCKSGRILNQRCGDADREAASYESHSQSGRLPVSLFKD